MKREKKTNRIESTDMPDAVAQRRAVEESLWRIAKSGASGYHGGTKQEAARKRRAAGRKRSRDYE